MPDTLPVTLYPWERKATADRLWKLIAMIDAQRPASELREAVVFTVREIEPFLAEYPKDRPINMEARNG
jgi:hypothetical protein